MKTPDLNIFAKAKDLKDRIVFTILALVIYRFGSYIPLPSINPFVLQNFNEQNAGGLLGMFNMLSGGSLGRMSIFALAIMPYITSSIIVQLLSVVVKPIEQLRKEGDSGRRKLNQYTRYLTVAISILQGYGLAVSLEHIHAGDMALINNPGAFFRLTSVVTLTTGTMFLMWLGEQITARGIGNGTSLIIFSGIVSGLPSAIASTLSLGKAGALSPIVIIAVLVIIFGLILLINFMEKASRKIIVQYPKRQVGNKMYGGESTHIPLKLNTAGVIPPIFASSLLLFPVTLANFATDKTSFLANFVAANLGHGKFLYMLLFAALIMFFAFFYTSIVFNPNETAENLKKYGGFVPGRRPGANTAEYFDYVLTRITVIGAAYISVVCILPEIMMSKFSIPFYLGGTSLLIVVNVITDTMTQIQTHLFSKQYEGLMNKVKLREKRA